MAVLSNLLLTLLSLQLATSAPTLDLKVRGGSNTVPLPHKTIAQLQQKPTWFENACSTDDGDILITQLVPTAVLFLLKDPSSAKPVLTEVLTFPNATGALGIARTKPNTYIAVAGKYKSIGVPIPGTHAAWEITYDPNDKKSPAPKLRKITDFPDAVFLNGLEPVPGHEDLVVISDSTAGSLIRLNTRTGKYKTVLQAPELAPLPDKPISVGINGIKLHDGYLYFDNSFATTIYRVKIGPRGKPVAGAKIETVAVVSGAPFLDDFAFSDDGKIIYAATNLGHTLYAVHLDGKTPPQLVLGSATELTIAGDTALLFGATRRDKDTLYVMTGGGLANPINGTVTEPAKVVAVDTSKYN